MTFEYQGFSTYTTEDHLSTIKENFRLLAQRITLHKNQLNFNSKVLDVGCATGALIGFLCNVYPDYSYVGVDISDDLLALAKKQIPNASWMKASAISLPERFTEHFNIVIQFGVLGIFDEYDAQQSINELLRCVNRGYVYIFAQFNDFDVDVWVKHKKYKSKKIGGWESGWNIYSKRTVSNWLNGKVDSFRFIDFNMPFQIEKKDDPVRTWTVKKENGKLQLVNGLNLCVNLKLLEIQL